MEKYFIQADMHTHTLASTHAYSTITENAKYASEIGLKAIAMTDHVNLMPDSPHIWHLRNMKRVLPRQIFGVTVVRGAEVNIADFSGAIDTCDSDLDTLDWVVLSYHKHYFRNYSTPDPKAVTDGYIKAFENRRIDIVGHPTASTFPVEWERLVPAAKEAGVLLELNESSINSGKSPASAVAEMLRLCKKYGCMISVDTDAHFWSRIGEITNCKKALYEADFPVKLIANSDWESLCGRILAKRPDIDL